MKKAALLFLICNLAIPVNFIQAQEKPKTEAAATADEKTLTPLRVQIIFSEYDGDKKVSSLSYTLPVEAELGNIPGPKASIRMGLRVPILTSPNQFQYVDLGTNIDGRASRTTDGRFNLHLTLERSSVYNAKDVAQKAGGSEVSTQPVIQTFRTEIDLLLRDGQTTQSTLAADPASGRVTKVDVTLSLAK